MVIEALGFKNIQESSSKSIKNPMNVLSNVTVLNYGDAIVLLSEREFRLRLCDRV